MVTIDVTVWATAFDRRYESRDTGFVTIHAVIPADRSDETASTVDAITMSDAEKADEARPGQRACRACCRSG